MQNRTPLSRDHAPHGFIPPHALADRPITEPVLVAFSGGPDSRTLLHLLAADAAQKGYSLFAAHVNHGIRGEEADRDEAFCRSIADALGVPLFVLHADIPTLAEQTGQSIETAARNARYNFFSSLMQEHRIPILATAHNADDNLETLLFDLIRGCGLDGLCGIPPARPVSGGMLVRPLLACDREQILAYCRTHDLSYVTDSTNTDTQYTRNRIRAELLPALRAMEPSIVAHVTRTCDVLRADASYLRNGAENFLAQHRDGYSLPLTALQDAPTPIASRALMLLFKELTGGVALEQSHVRALLALAEQATPHAKADLPCGCHAVIENGRLWFGEKKQKNERQSQAAPYCVTLHKGNNPISQADCEIFIENSQSTKNVYKNEIRMYLASDKIVGNMTARNRRAGDKILSCGMHKDVRRLMSEKKLPLAWRDRLPVLCDGQGVLAVPTVAVRDGVSKKNLQEGVTEVRICFLSERANDFIKNRKG